MLPAPLNTREIKQRADMLAIVGQYTLLKRSGRQYRGLCPFHSESHPSLYVDSEKKIFHCFGCGAGGDLFAFVMAVEGCSFREALNIVVGFCPRNLGEATEARRFVTGRGSEGAAGPQDRRSRSVLIARKPEPKVRAAGELPPLAVDCAAERTALHRRGYGESSFTCQEPDNSR
jgi:hypothetical protein